MLRAVIFDFNGVILDDEPVHMMMFQKVLAEEGLVLSQEDYYAHYLGMDDVGCLETVYKNHNQKVTTNKIEELVQKKSKLYDAYIAKNMQLFPKSIDVVKKATAKYKTAIVSGALKHEIEFALKEAGAKKEFKVIVAQEDVDKGKPDPEGYLKALDMLNEQIKPDEKPLMAAECLVIEDSLEGIHSAKEAGMRVAAVAHTYETARLTPEADWVFEKIGQISFKEIEPHF